MSTPTPKTLEKFAIGEIYATGPGHGLIGTKVGEESVFDLVNNTTKFVPAKRLGTPLCAQVLAELKKRLNWEDLKKRAKKN